MAELHLLDPDQHAGLRVALDNAGDRHFVQIVAAEVASAMLDYPIFFTKHPESGAFYAGAVMGLEPGTNLIARDGMLPGYRPADLVRQGFFVSDDRIAIDPDSPVFAGHGESLFDPGGAPAPALRRVQQAMQLLHEGLEPTATMIRRFVEHRLIEPIDVTLDFDDGGRLQLDGLYSVSLDTLQRLPDDVALDLLRRGDLQIAYLQAASIQHVRRLARIRNDSLAGVV